MTIYFITFFIILCTSFAAQLHPRSNDTSISARRKERTRNFWVFLTILPLAFFSGFRYQVGADWYAYYNWSHESFKTYIFSEVLEQGWNVLGFLTTLVWNRYGVAMLAASIITCWLCVKTIDKNCSKFCLGMILYFLLEWHNSFNGVRQCLAASILFSGYAFIQERKWKQWIGIVLLATCFHTTAILGLAFYFLTNQKMTIKHVFFVAIIGVAALFSYDRIFEILEWYKNNTFNFERDTYISAEINILRILLAWIPILVYGLLTVSKQRREYSKRTNILGNFALLHAIFMTAAQNSAYFGRIGMYTGPFLILFWPEVIKRENKSNAKVLTICVLLLYSVFWFYEIYSHEDLNHFQLWIGR